MSYAILRTARQAAAALKPARRRLLEALAEPDSASGLARRLGLPRQRLNYHLRELEKAGLVELVEERRRGNFMERVVRATARHYLVSPEALGELGREPEEISDRFSAAWLVASAGRAIRDVAELRARADASGKTVATLTLTGEVRFADASARNAFAEELAGSVARLTAKYHDAAAPSGRTFRLLAAAYPKVHERREAKGKEKP